MLAQTELSHNIIQENGVKSSSPVSLAHDIIQEDESKEFKLYTYIDIVFINKTGADIEIKMIWKDATRNPQITVMSTEPNQKQKMYKPKRLEALNIDKIQSFDIYYVTSKKKPFVHIDAQELKKKLEQKNATKVTLEIEKKAAFHLIVQGPSQPEIRNEKLVRQQLFSKLGTLLTTPRPLTPQSKSFEIFELPAPPRVSDTRELLTNQAAVAYRKALEEKYERLKKIIEGSAVFLDKDFSLKNISNGSARLLQIVRSAHEEILEAIKAI